MAATVHDLNVCSMSTEQSIAELQALAAAGVVVTHLEVGNETCITKRYGWRYPTAADYRQAGRARGRRVALHWYQYMYRSATNRDFYSAAHLRAGCAAGWAAMCTGLLFQRWP